MPWFDDSHDADQSEPRGGTYHEDRNPDGSSGPSCPMAIPRVVWTILKVTFNAVVLGKRPGYVQ